GMFSCQEPQLRAEFFYMLSAVRHWPTADVWDGAPANSTPAGADNAAHSLRPRVFADTGASTTPPSDRSKALHPAGVFAKPWPKLFVRFGQVKGEIYYEL